MDTQKILNVLKKILDHDLIDYSDSNLDGPCCVCCGGVINHMTGCVVHESGCPVKEAETLIEEVDNAMNEVYIG